MNARPALLHIVAAIFALPLMARAQGEPSVAFDELDGAAVMNALAKECYEARLVSDTPAADVLDCSGVIEERFIGGAPDNQGKLVVTHRLRFTLLGRAAADRISAQAWTQTEELDNVIEQPVTSADYLQRVQRVLTTVVARLKSPAPPSWVGRYDSEQAWRLDAHLHAVRHCEAHLAGMTTESVAQQLASVGLLAIDEGVRDRCEQLHTHLFEWGLARGDDDPTVGEFARYRAALPPEQRSCSGQLAPDATCPP